MDFPHIYRPFDFFVGLMMIAVGVPLFVRELLRFRKRPLRTWEEEARYLAMGFWYLTSGPSFLSHAFDPPHQESPLTGDLNWEHLQ